MKEAVIRGRKLTEQQDSLGQCHSFGAQGGKMRRRLA